MIKFFSLCCFAGLLWINAAFGESCEKTDKARCIHRKDCILDCDADYSLKLPKCTTSYYCRSPKNECERNWNSSVDTSMDERKASCERTSGCEFNQGLCVCPCDFRLPGEPMCNCACGGGPPPACLLN